MAIITPDIEGIDQTAGTNATGVAVDGAGSPAAAVFDLTIDRTPPPEAVAPLTNGGAGELRLATATSSTAGLTLDAGTLDASALGAVGSGTITFADPAGGGIATLEVDAAALTGSNGQYNFANLIAGATSAQQVIDLTSLPYVQGSTAATLDGTVLSASDGSSDVTLHLAKAQPGSSWVTARDANGGTLVYDPPASLLTNGDFEAGNTGFTTNYTYEPPNQTVSTGQGEYSIVSNPGSSFINLFASYGDHTDGTGQMMFVDGATSGAPFWSETVSLAANTAYSFTYFVTGADTTSLPQITFSLNGQTIDSGFQVTAAGGYSNWQQVTESFTTAGAGTAVLALGDTNPVAAGNDFTIDDLALGVAGNVPAVTTGNLLTNGSFEAGNTGFSSDYSYHPPGDGNNTGVQQYSLVHNPGMDLSNGYDLYGDHSSGSGEMLFVDGAQGGAGSGSFWKESVNLNANTTYAFTYFVTGADSSNLPSIGLTLKDPSQITTTLDSGFAVTAAGGGTAWQQVTGTFTTSSAGVYTLGMFDNVETAEGNDFTVDDLSLVVAAPTVVPETATVLAGSTVSATASNGALAGDSDASGGTLTIGAVSYGGTTDGVAAGSTSTNNATTVAGAYGTLTIGADGSYSYAAATNGLPADNGSSLIDTFGDTVLSSEGTSASSSLAVTLAFEPAITVNAFPGGPSLNAAEIAAGPVISGTVTDIENGQTVSVEVLAPDGATVLAQATTTVANGAFSVPFSDLSSALPDATGDEIVVDATNTQGLSAEGTATFSIDTVPPSVAITSGGGLVGTATQSITGTGESGTTLVVDVDGSTAGTMTVARNGTWTVSVTLGAIGSHSVTAIDTDQAGNVSTSNAVAYDYENLPTLATPTINTPPLLSSNPTPTITGTGVAGSAITLTDEQRIILRGLPTHVPLVLGTTTVTGDGTWSFLVGSGGGPQLPVVASDISFTGDVTSYELSAVTTETGFSPSVAASTPELQLDTTAPAITLTTASPANLAPSEIDGVITGNALDPADDEDGTLAVTITDADTLNGVTTTTITTVTPASTTGTSGAFSAPFSQSLGTHVITASATDAAGNTGTSAPITIELDHAPLGVAIDMIGQGPDNVLSPDYMAGGLVVYGTTTVAAPKSITLELDELKEVFDSSGNDLGYEAYQPLGPTFQANLNGGGTWGRSLPTVDFNQLVSGQSYRLDATVSDGTSSTQTTQTFVVDNAPTITSASIQGQAAGSTLTYPNAYVVTLNLNQAVTVVGAGLQLALINGEYATYTGTVGSPTQTLTFAYSPQGDATSDLIADGLIGTYATDANGFISLSEFHQDLGVAVSATMPSGEVTTAADSGAGSLRAAITYADAHPGTTITFSNAILGDTITLASDLPIITGTNTVIDGGADDITINGAGTYRGFFVGDSIDPVTATIDNLNIVDTLAKGGDGGGGPGDVGGGGGAGLGGAIFVADNASLTISGLQFTDDAAQGGNGGYSPYEPVGKNPILSGTLGYGGGGGLGGNGGVGFQGPATTYEVDDPNNPILVHLGGGGGGGGLGTGANGGTAPDYTGGSGDLIGGAAAGVSGYLSNNAGGSDAGGGGSGSANALSGPYAPSVGGGGGLDDDIDEPDSSEGLAGGYGGFGGGGGGSSAVGGDGGFGGGGGGAFLTGYNVSYMGSLGGWGGGGGGVYGFDILPDDEIADSFEQQYFAENGGFGAGSGLDAGVSTPADVSDLTSMLGAGAGGGGLGAGGALFVMEGGSLTIGGNIGETGSSVAGGIGGASLLTGEKVANADLTPFSLDSNDGDAYGSALFLQGGTGDTTDDPDTGLIQQAFTGAVTFDPGLGQLQTFAGTVADEAGNGGTASRGIVKNGLGTLDFAGANSYTGGTVINAGTFEIDQATAAGTGAITFGTPGGTLLVNYTGTSAPNIALASFAVGDTITFKDQTKPFRTVDTALVKLYGNRVIVTGNSLTLIAAAAPDITVTSTGGPVKVMTQTISGTVDVADAGSSVTLSDNATPIGTPVTVAADGTWSESITLTGIGANIITAADTNATGNGTSNAVTYSLAKSSLTDDTALAFSSTYEAVFYALVTGGTLEIIDSANGNAIVGTMTLSGNFAGELFTLASDGATGTTINLASFPLSVIANGDVLISNVSGQAYVAYEALYQNGVSTGIDYDFTAVPNGAAYSSYVYNYSAGNAFIGSAFFYTNVTGQPYTGDEYDYDGGGHNTRVILTGVTDAAYSSYEYDYAGGDFAGSKFEVTSVPSGASYSSYELDYDQTGAFTGDKFFFTNVTGQSYSGEEEDFNAAGKLAQVLLTGVTGQTYSSLEEDYSAGTYEGYKAFYTALSGQAYTAEEVDVNAAGQITGAAYSGLSGTPYSAVSETFSDGTLTGATYDFTGQAGQSFTAYQAVEDANGNPLQEIVDNSDGSHTMMGYASNQTFTSLGNDTMTGGGSNETFDFNAVFGHDTITDFASHLSVAGHDTISFASSEFSSFAAVLADAANADANVVITAPTTHDTLTLTNMTTTQLAAAGADFTFHA